MISNEITAIVGAHKRRKRVGRGKGSGHGKTSGRGHKGCMSRAGAGGRVLHEGGQIPYFRRLPKRGFNNYNFSTRFEIVNISQLENVFNDGMAVGITEMVNAGLVDGLKSRVKVLGDGELTKKLEVSAHKFSKTAEQKIADCGGNTKVVA